MQRWEYMLVVGGSNASGAFRVQYVNGEQLSGWETGPRTHEYLNRWGAEGWEVVSYTESTWETEVSGLTCPRFLVHLF